jgi:alkylation response protein AidB-like acyl-CoA dehydrogenase
MIAETMKEIVDEYDHDYWRTCADNKRFPSELWNTLGETGILGINVPEEYGGEGLGTREMALVTRILTRNGVPLIFLVPHPAMAPIVVDKHGSEDLKERMLPKMAGSEHKFAFAITESNAGTNSFQMTTSATNEGGEYVISGEKAWITGADIADYILLVCRTTPYEEVKDTNPKQGGSLILVPTDLDGINMEPMELAVNKEVNQCIVHFDDVRVEESLRIGEEGKGFDHVFDILNPERIVGAAWSAGLGEFVLDRGVEYAKEREVFDAPIGSHQAIQHPMAKAKVELEQAYLTIQESIEAWEQGREDTGQLSNMAKYAASEAADNALDIAMQAHGGNAVSPDYDIITVANNVRLNRITPINNEMILNSVGENLLGLPKSY